MTARSEADIAGPWFGPADTVSQAAGAALILIGIAAVGCSGALAATLGGGTIALYVVGGAVLVAAMASSYAALAVLIVMLLVPLGFADAMPVRLNGIDLVYGAALAGLAQRTVATGGRLTSTPLLIATLAYLLAGVIALVGGILASGDAVVALGHFRGLFGFALIPALVLSLGERGPEQRRQLILLLCAAGAVTAARGVLSWGELNGVFQLNGVLHRLAAPDSQEGVGVVPALSGDFGYLRAVAGNFEGNTLGGFALMLFPIAAFAAWRPGGSLQRVLFGAGAVLLLVALLVSYSRGAFFGLAVISALVLVVVGRRQPLTTIALAAVGGVFVFFLVNQLPGADDRLATLRVLGDDPTVQHRQLVYREAFAAILRSPVWGVGLGTNISATGAGADSLYVFLPLRGGLLLAGAFVGVVWLAGKRVIEALRRGWLGGLDVAVLLGLCGFAAHAAVDYTLWNPKVALTVWLLVGFLLAAALERRETRADVVESEAGRPASW